MSAAPTACPSEAQIQDTVGQAQASLASAWRAPEVVGVGCHIRMDFLVSCRDGSPGTVSPYT